jgi:hypothetical protein
MRELTTNELPIVNGGFDSGVCSVLVVGGGTLLGAGLGAYATLGFGAGAGAKGGAILGGFAAAYLCF